jgi:hypothetical protein
MGLVENVDRAPVLESIADLRVGLTEVGFMALSYALQSIAKGFILPSLLTIKSIA